MADPETTRSERIRAWAEAVGACPDCAHDEAAHRAALNEWASQRDIPRTAVESADCPPDPMTLRDYAHSQGVGLRTLYTWFKASPHPPRPALPDLRRPSGSGRAFDIYARADLQTRVHRPRRRTIDPDLFGPGQRFSLFAIAHRAGMDPANLYRHDDNPDFPSPDADNTYDARAVATWFNNRKR